MEEAEDVEPAQAAAAAAEAKLTMNRLNDSAVVLAKGKAALDALRERRAKANATATMALEQVAAAKVMADDAKERGQTAAKGLVLSNDKLKNATPQPESAKILAQAEKLAKEALRLKRAGLAAISDVHYEGLLVMSSSKGAYFSEERNAYQSRYSPWRRDSASF